MRPAGRFALAIMIAAYRMCDSITRAMLLAGASAG
jgi:hypothetical protein